MNNLEPDDDALFDESDGANKQTAVKLPIDRQLQREISMGGIDAPVLIALSGEGIEMRVAGTSNSIVASWKMVTECMVTPSGVPSFLRGKPLAFLQYQAKRLTAVTAEVNRLIDSAIE